MPSAVTPGGDPRETHHTKRISARVQTSYVRGGLTELTFIMGSVIEGVADSDAAASFLGLHLPAHDGTCVLSLNTDNGDIPWI